MLALLEEPSLSSRRTINSCRARMCSIFCSNTKVLIYNRLINVLKAANQEVPEALLRFGGTVKKKQHDVYGAFYKANDDGKAATKIKFDD